MSDEAGFLKSIAKQPVERSTRLVYADWLDEHDRPREAEFLRLQLQIAELSARVSEISAQLEVPWLTAVGNVRIEPHSFTLRSGRNVWLRSLRQWRFYESLLEGLPTAEMNQEFLAEALATAS